MNAPLAERTAMKKLCNFNILLVWLSAFLQHVLVTNPVINIRYSADPSAHIWPNDPDTVWIYGSHDQDEQKEMDEMAQYYVYSSKDLVHWEDHGLALHLDNVTWAKSNMWAPDAAYRDGTYYLIYCAKENAPIDQYRTGLAISDRPGGPFKDIGFIKGVEWGQDPALFIDDDGTPYLYWGCGGRAKVVQLTDDFREAVPGTEVDLTKQMPNFYEGPWVYKHNGLYYMMYAAKDNQDESHWGEWLEYSTAAHPKGPFTFGGMLMDTLDLYPEVGESWTNHGSIINFKGQWYLFYHTAKRSGGNGKRRSVAIEYLHHNPDGSISQMIPTLRGVAAVPSHSHPHHHNVHTHPGLEHSITQQEEHSGEHSSTHHHHRHLFLKRRLQQANMRR